MNEMKFILWLFPILFMFHDFEEIIFMQAWLNKNRSYLRDKFPGLSSKLLPHFDTITTPAFALGVAEEFILLSIITIVSYAMDCYSLWVGLFVAFTVHLIIHCLQALVVRKYIPALITSVICLPVCFYIIRYIVVLFPLDMIIWYSVLGIILMLVNIYGIHKAMKRFNTWLARYERQSK